MLVQQIRESRHANKIASDALELNRQQIENAKAGSDTTLDLTTRSVAALELQASALTETLKFNRGAFDQTQRAFVSMERVSSTPPELDKPMTVTVALKNTGRVEATGVSAENHLSLRHGDFPDPPPTPAQTPERGSLGTLGVEGTFRAIFETRPFNKAQLDAMADKTNPLRIFVWGSVTYASLGQRHTHDYCAEYGKLNQWALCPTHNGERK